MPHAIPLLHTTVNSSTYVRVVMVEVNRIPNFRSRTEFDITLLKVPLLAISNHVQLSRGQ